MTFGLQKLLSITASSLQTVRPVWSVFPANQDLMVKKQVTIVGILTWLGG